MRGTRGTPHAPILIVGEAYSANEEREQKPFIGSSGKELDQMLMEAGIKPTDCLYTNVVNKRPPRNDMTQFFFSNAEAKQHKLTPIRGLYPKVEVLEGINELEELIRTNEPKLIIAAGNYPLWALTEGNFKIGNSNKTKIPTGIADYRGSQLHSRFFNIPLLPIYHPVAVLRQWSWRPSVVHDLRARAQKILRGQPWDEPARQYLIQPSFSAAMEYLQDILLRAQLSSSSPILLSCDIETAMQHTECIGLAASPSEAICIPLMCRARWEGYWSPHEEVNLLTVLRQLLEHPNVEVLGQNFLYDFQYFFGYHATKPNYRQDTMLAHHVCYPGTPAGLNYISSMYCSHHAYWKDDGKEASKNHDDTQRWIYNARDCVVTYEAMTALWEVIAYHGQEMQYAIQMARANAAIDEMMLRGVRIDRKRKSDEANIHMETEMEMAAELENLLPEQVYPRKPKASPWYRSPTQLAELFYDVFGVAEVKDNKTGSRTTKDEALEIIAGREPILVPLISKLQDYRSLETYGQFIGMKLSPDNRARCTFSPTTETFRYRSSEDAFGVGRNMQNLPKGSEE